LINFVPPKHVVHNTITSKRRLL